jgi:hypothetical protein
MRQLTAALTPPADKLADSGDCLATYDARDWNAFFDALGRFAQTIAPFVIAFLTKQTKPTA